MNLAEQYRPQTWAELVGQPDIVATVDTLRRCNRIGGQSYWIVGPSGAGKSTIARLLAREIASPWSIAVYDGASMSAADVEEIARILPCYGMPDSDGRTGRAIIIEEAHGLRAQLVTRLLLLAETPPKQALLAFTTTIAGDALFDGGLDSGPLKSRCVPLELSRRDIAQAMADRAQYIAEREGLGGAPATAYLRAVRDARNNLRAVLQRVAAGDFARTAAA